MRLIVSENKVLEIAGLALLLLAAPAAVQNLEAGGPTNNGQVSEATVGGQIHIPNPASTPLSKGKQGKQKTEIHFDPAAPMATVKLLVQDPNGYFIPNIGHDNFVVYENGVRQQNATVEIEHGPVTLGLLLEFGGRAQALNRLLGLEVSRAGHQLLDVLGREDKVAIWKYSDRVERLADFSQGHETLDRLFQERGAQEFSETNLYDALIPTVEQMQTVTGRKAIILISSGIDTFGKVKYEDASRAVRDCDTPIYVISLTPIPCDIVDMHEMAGPLARVDWNRREFQEIARASGVRALLSREHYRSLVDLRRHDGKPQSAVRNYVSILQRPRLELAPHSSCRTARSEDGRPFADLR